MQILFNGKQIYMSWEKIFDKIKDEDISKITIPELIQLIDFKKLQGKRG